MSLTSRQQVIAAALTRAFETDSVWVDGTPAIKAALEAENVAYREAPDGLLEVFGAADVLARAIDDAILGTSDVLARAIFEGERTRLSERLGDQASHFGDKQAATTTEKSAVDGVAF